MTGIDGAPNKHCVFKLRQRLRAMPDDRYLQYLIAYHAAPTLLGLKPATLICPNATGRDLEGVFSGDGPCLGQSFGVEVAGLRNGAGALLCLIYDRALVASVLAEPEVRELLIETGYDRDALTVDACLAALRERCSGPRFPHEIGVFLGYPAREVRTFMRYGGKSCRKVGCWKAYHDVDEVTRRSARFDCVKAYAAEIIAGGAELGEVMDKLRAVA